MNAVYGYNPENQRFSLEWEEKVYYFTWDSSRYTVINAWNEEGKLIARSYKGFRNKLGIQGGSAKANTFINLINESCKIILGIN